MSQTNDLETELDHELRAERAMLEHARNYLAAMRRRAESLTASSGGDWVSEEVLSWRLRQRIASLADDGQSALFFGRIDYDRGAEPPAMPAATGRVATASSPAARATALLTAEATPACSALAAASTVAVSGATVSDRPRANTSTPGRTSTR